MFRGNLAATEISAQGLSCWQAASKFVWSLLWLGRNASEPKMVFKKAFVCVKWGLQQERETLSFSILACDLFSKLDKQEDEMEVLAWGLDRKRVHVR